ncbi:LOW QUALITY PROTEIN: choline transporter-like protein 3 [Rhynochetos jubatus]
MCPGRRQPRHRGPGRGPTCTCKHTWARPRSPVFPYTPASPRSLARGRSIGETGQHSTASTGHPASTTARLWLAVTGEGFIWRKCTGTLWLLSFPLFWDGLMFITGCAVMAGAAERLVLGYNSFRNACGRKNSPVNGAALSGQDVTKKKYQFFLNSCRLEMQNLKTNSLSLCVSSCPQEQLSSLEDLQSFARNNASCLCIYSLDSCSYTLNPKAAELCPTLPVPPSKSFPLFNCVAQNPECYSKYASVLISMINEMHVFHILSGILAGRDTLIGLSVLALAFSFILVLAFRFIWAPLVHTSLALVVFGLLFALGVLWWLCCDYRGNPSTQPETENVTFLLGCAIFSTIITVVLLSHIIVLRKRLQFTVQLFIVGRIIVRIPFLLFQPLWTFLILTVSWIFWVAVLLSLGTANIKVTMVNSQVDVPDFYAAEHRAVHMHTCKVGQESSPPPHPVLSSMFVLLCYHLGTAVKGSVLITILRIPSIVLLYLCNILNQKESACAKCLFKCCFCRFWCQESCLRYFNQHANTTTAINGTDFCTSAKDAVFILAKNSAKLAPISCFGDFVEFLERGGVFVVCFTIFAGLMHLNYQRELESWVVPLLLVGFFAYLMSHSFLSVFEVTADATFLCFAIDMDTNDGSAEKPYFMDQELLVSLSDNSKGI